MKKLNLKQPKYIFPLVVFLPLTFLAYEVSGIFDGNRTSSAKVATDSLNMELPDAENEGLKDKMAGMEDRNMGDDGYSAVDGLGDEENKGDSLGNGYSESEMDQIDKDNAERKAQQKAQQSQGSTSTPMQVAVIAVAEVPQGTAVVTNSMTMPKNLNTYKNVVAQPNEPSTKAMAVTEDMITMIIHIQMAMPTTGVHLGQQGKRHERKVRKCRR